MSFPPKDVSTGSGAAPAFPVTSATAGVVNVANSIDGSDGSVTGLATTVVGMPGATLHSAGNVNPVNHSGAYPAFGMGETAAPIVVSTGGGSGPSRHNVLFVVAPTGDIGSSVSGGVSGVTVARTKYETASVTAGGSPAAEVSSATT